jgi:hypothetical protein
VEADLTDPVEREAGENPDVAEVLSIEVDEHLRRGTGERREPTAPQPVRVEALDGLISVSRIRRE